MKKSPILVYGYLPKCVKFIESFSTKYSDTSDIMRLGPGIKINQVRHLLRFMSSVPLSKKSLMKTAVLDFNNISSGVQNSLLKVIEEVPDNSLILLYKRNCEGILETILSRCIRFKFEYPGYGESIKDLTRGGLSYKAAANLANFIELGYDFDISPTAQDYTNAKALINSGFKGDFESGIFLSEGFSKQALIALRRELLLNKEIIALKLTYKINNPENIALGILSLLVNK